MMTKEQVRALADSLTPEDFEEFARRERAWAIKYYSLLTFVFVAGFVLGSVVL